MCREITCGLVLTHAFLPVQVFHAGTVRDGDGNIAAAGGRVLGISAIGKDVVEAQKKAYEVGLTLFHLG